MPATVQNTHLDSELVRRAGKATTGIVVLPLRNAEGKAIYSEPSVTLVKELRAGGVEASYLDPSGERAFEVKKSDLADLVLQVVVGIASNASWEGLKALLRRKPNERLSVTYLELDDGAGRKGVAWRVDGDTESVLEAIDALRAVSIPDGEIERGPT